MGGEVAGSAHASWSALQECQETSESTQLSSTKPLSLLQMAQREHQVQRSKCVVQSSPAALLQIHQRLP